VEAVTPIAEPAIAKELEEILGIMLSDNRQAWELQSDGSYIQRRPDNEGQESSTHVILMEKALKSAGISQ
jgi:polyphosphate kinase